MFEFSLEGVELDNSVFLIYTNCIVTGIVSNKKGIERNQECVIFFADYCIYGEYKGAILHHNGENCQDLIRGKNWLCSKTFEGGFCCESCRN